MSDQAQNPLSQATRGQMALGYSNDLQPVGGGANTQHAPSYAHPKNVYGKPAVSIQESPMTLAEAIADAISLKPGNKDFALFGFEDGSWRASLGNISSHVMLGEIPGEFEGDADSPEAAVAALKENLIAGKRNLP